MADQIRVNIKHRVNNAAIRREKRNGRDVIVVPSATLPDDVVMNGIKYPAAVIEAGYKTFERTHAPLGHPMVNGAYVSAADPEALNGYWVGARNENVRRDNGRVYMDKIIDVETAQGMDRGRKLLEAIEKREPISTSTGLLLDVANEEGEGYDRVALSMIGDHDAFLLDEEPAASTAQGVGVFVNAKGEQVEVVNSELEMDDDLLTMMAWEMVNEYDRAEKRQRNGSLVERIKNAVRAVMNGNKTEDEATGLTANQSTGDSEMTVTKEAFDALNAKVDALVANAEKQPSVAEQITEALKPVTEQLQANAEAEKAKAEAEKTTLVETVVEAKLATEEEAKALDVNALHIMARNCKAPKGADHPLNGGRLNTNASDDVMSQYAAPKGDE